MFRFLTQNSMLANIYDVSSHYSRVKFKSTKDRYNQIKSERERRDSIYSYLLSSHSPPPSTSWLITNLSNQDTWLAVGVSDKQHRSKLFNSFFGRDSISNIDTHTNIPSCPASIRSPTTSKNTTTHREKKSVHISF